MTPELGQLALILACLVAVVQGTLPLLGAHRGHAGWIALARPAAQTQFTLVLFAFGCLMQAFLANDFSVLYVAQHSNAQLPAVYRAAAVWGGHEGSLLLWLLMLSGWTCAVSLLSRQLPDAMVARVIGVLGLVAGVMGLFALIPGLPKAPFIIIAAVFGGLAYVLHQQRRQAATADTAAPAPTCRPSAPRSPAADWSSRSSSRAARSPPSSSPG